MSAVVLTLPIHKPIDWLNSLSNTSQFVRLGLRQYLEAGLSCSSKKLIRRWSDIVSSFETSHACISCMIDPDAWVISITGRLLPATKVGSAPMLTISKPIVARYSNSRMPRALHSELFSSLCGDC